jgi:S-adenosylmethionine synthetase
MGQAKAFFVSRRCDGTFLCLRKNSKKEFTNYKGSNNMNNLERKRIFTSESVTEGHPDKVCDAISDAVLDAYLAFDENARVACETAVSENLVVVMGEISANCKKSKQHYSQNCTDVTSGRVASDGCVNIEQIVRDTVKSIGYTDGKSGINPDT